MTDEDDKFNRGFRTEFYETAGKNVYIYGDEDEDDSGLQAITYENELILYVHGWYDGGYVAGTLNIDLVELLQQLGYKIVKKE